MSTLHQHAQRQPVVDRSGRPAAAGARLHGWVLVIARGLWLVVVAPAVAVFVAALPVRFQQLLALPAATEQALAALGLSAAAYAAYVFTFDVACVLVATLVAALIFWRRSADWIGIYTSLALVLFGTQFTAVMKAVQVPPAWEVPATLMTTGWSQLYPMLWAVRGLPPLLELPATVLSVAAWICLLNLFYLFPTGRFAPGWTRWAAVGWTLWVLWLLTPGAPFSPYALPPLAWYLSVMAWFCTGLVAQLQRFRRLARPAERQQTKWFVFGALGAFVGYFGLVLPSSLVPALSQPGLPALLFTLLFVSGMAISAGLMPLSIGIAIVRYQLLDIDVIINRALVYGALTAALAAVYFGSVVLLQGLVRGFTGQDPELVVVVSTLASAALFQPLRERLQRFIDRRFYRRKYDAARTLAAFNARLRHEVDLASLTNDLVGVVEETMQPTHVSLWLRTPDGAPPPAER